jgi:uncharacterized repeat protein (TIGR03943 family)
MTVDRARLGRAMCLLAFALLIAKLLATGQMVKYMTPALDPLSAVTGIVLTLMAGIEIRAATRVDWLPGEGRPRPRARDGPRGVELALTALLVLAPVALGLLVTPRALGSGALGGAEVSRLLLAFGSERAAAGAGAPVTDSGAAPLEDLAELLTHLRQVGERGIGRRVRVTGMAATSAALAPNELALLRYAIAHCVADARPLALLVVAPGAVAFAGDQWVEIEGVVAARQREGDRLVTVVAERITPVDEPTNPYLGAGY